MGNGRVFEDVFAYPRPPRLERTRLRLRVVWRPYHSSIRTCPSGSGSAGAQSGGAQQGPGARAAQLSGAQELVLADSTRAYRVLETSHPPTYYLPSEDVKTSLLSKSARSSFCEWKGVASYWDLQLPSSGGETTVKDRIWSYERPSASFAPIKDHLAFYASAGTTPAGQGGWLCFVEDEQVKAQEGDFYGGWTTAEIVSSRQGGKMKGGPGTWGW